MNSSTRRRSRLPLLIYGAGGHAREVFQLLQDCNMDRRSWEVVGFASEDAEEIGGMLYDLPIQPCATWLRQKIRHVSIAIGDNAARRRVAGRLKKEDVEFPAIIHPTVLRGRSVDIADGSQIAAYAQLTTDIAIGAFVLINRAVNVSHDCRLGEYSSLAPGVQLAGGVQIGTGTSLGIGAMAIPSVKVGEWSVVGAGSVLVRNTASNVVVVGNPAHITRHLQEGWQDRRKQ